MNVKCSKGQNAAFFLDQTLAQGLQIRAAEVFWKAQWNLPLPFLHGRTKKIVSEEDRPLHLKSGCERRQYYIVYIV